MKQKPTIGANPLEAYLDRKKKATPQATKQRITIHLTKDLIERVKDAVFWQPGMTLTSLAEEALETALKKLEKTRGSTYPKRTQNNLKGGRPLL